MNKSQRIVIVITLLIMAAILFYPPLEKKYTGTTGRVHAIARGFIFNFPPYEKGSTAYQLDTERLIAEILAIAALGGAVTLIFGLKKKD